MMYTSLKVNRNSISALFRHSKHNPVQTNNTQYYIICITHKTLEVISLIFVYTIYNIWDIP